MTKAMVTGSFDPVTLGHIDVILRAAKCFDSVCVGVLVNPEKSYMFSPDERLAMLRVALSGKDIEVYFSDGYAVDLCKKVHADVMVRGLREGDFSYERKLAEVNLSLGVPTVFLSADEKFASISSSRIKKMIENGERLDGLVPEEVIGIIERRGK